MTDETKAQLSLGPRVVSVKNYGSDSRYTVKPLDFKVPLLAAELADKWIDVSTESNSISNILTTAIKMFCASVGDQLSTVGSLETFSLNDLRRRHLDAWEYSLVEPHAQAATDTYYRYVVYLFALLRRAEQDAPGTLDSGVMLRLEQIPRLAHVRNEGTSPYSSRETARIRSRAHQIVYKYLTSDMATGPKRNELIALHVLLSLATGEPPEVVRQLTVDRISATTDAASDVATVSMSPSARLTWLAQNDRIEQLAVTYVKNRSGGARKVDVYTRTDRAVMRSYISLFVATAALRARSAPNILWAYENRDASPRAPRWNDKGWALGAWFTNNRIEVDGPPWYQRLRKVVLAREAQTLGGAYLRKHSRHTSRTFLGHYTNSPVLRAHVGTVLIDTIQGYFDTARKAPVVITPGAEKILKQGGQAEGVDPQKLGQLINGELEGPHTACVDPTDSPFEKPGVTCGKSMTGMCFGCSNAIITQDHLPAALLIAGMSAPERSADPQVWQENWRDLHLFITEVVIPAFPTDVIDSARMGMSTVPLDLGVANDVRGSQE